MTYLTDIFPLLGLISREMKKFKLGGQMIVFFKIMSCINDVHFSNE